MWPTLDYVSSYLDKICWRNKSVSDIFEINPMPIKVSAMWELMMRGLVFRTENYWGFFSQ